MNIPQCGLRPFEHTILTQMIQEHTPKSVYLETGGFEGGSLVGFGGLLPKDSTLISVDLPIREEFQEKLQSTALEMRGQGYDAHVIIGSSRDKSITKRVRDILDGREIDILFLDGDHTGFGVFSDTANYVPLVRKGGLVIIHDVGPCLPPKPEVRHKIYKNQIGCYAAWKDLGSVHKRKMIVQEGAGFGLVWLNK